MRIRSRLLCGALVLVAAVLPACGTGSSSTSSPSGKLAVVAAEDFWGSIARQLGGDRVTVTSLVANPDTDPHDYEPTPGDGRALAAARYVITNGIGYDPWTDKALNANPVAGRTVLKVGDLVGLKAGDNPHRWYSPGDVEHVITRITADYQKLKPADAAYFTQQHDAFETIALAQYKATIADIKAKYAGVPVGASESIFAPMADALGLRLVTPASFLTAISEGTDPTAADKSIVDRQVASKTIKVFVFNSQNSTPDVQRLVDAARANAVPVSTVTETLSPVGATFQAWQTRQLEALEAALAAAPRP
ncbi:MAG: putative cation transporter, periplasmic cation-binding protein [Acidimicrobiales bacterium]|jgi:zinc/manganese transport system substrate-binding protein|nr:putative cation transporter, periplasmic cation-binding protein [Acidimicrobiales bacterium]